MHRGRRISAFAHDLAGVVDVVRAAAQVPRDYSEVRHRAALPEKGVPYGIVGVVADADNLARIVDGVRLTQAQSREGAEVLNLDRHGRRSRGELHRQGRGIRGLARLVVHPVRVVGGQEDPLVCVAVHPALDDRLDVNREQAEDGRIHPGLARTCRRRSGWTETVPGRAVLTPSLRNLEQTLPPASVRDDELQVGAHDRGAGRHLSRIVADELWELDQRLAQDPDRDLTPGAIDQQFRTMTEIRVPGSAADVRVLRLAERPAIALPVALRDNGRGQAEIIGPVRPAMRRKEYGWRETPDRRDDG